MFLDPLRRVFSGGYQPFQVLVELLLIGISVNWCASVLHGTRGTRLLRGLMVVLVAATLIVRVLAGQLGWTRLELLYHYFVIGLGFIALVAFQPELRRALIQAGEMRLLRRRTQQDKVVAALVESAGFLSRNRYGALIAIQREVGLANWAEHGAQLDSEVNSRLLNTLFFPNSPLHDLGVIIRGTRVLAANCQFPTAESGDVEARLGSRHRAAVGLSQESDALVLVVSEETGTISLAERGKLTPMASLEKLEQELSARLGGADAVRRKAEPGRDWHGYWLLWRRILVVAPLTLLIWLLADQASMAQIDGVPVELRVVPPQGFAADVVAPRPAAFSLTLRGSKRETDWFAGATREQPLRLDWQPTGAYAKPGEQKLSAAELAAVFDELPAFLSRGVSVTGVAPDELRILVDELTSVELTLTADVGTHTLNDVRFDPPIVKALMRKSEADKLASEEKRLPVRLDERIAGLAPNETVKLTGIPLTDQRSSLRAVRITPDTASVTLQVAAQKNTKKVERVAVRMAVRPEFAQRYLIEPRDPNEWLASVELEGERTKLEGLRPEDIHAIVEISTDQLVGSNDYRTLEVRLFLPAGVQLVGRAPTVQVKITSRDKATP